MKRLKFGIFIFLLSTFFFKNAYGSSEDDIYEHARILNKKVPDYE